MVAWFTKSLPMVKLGLAKKQQNEQNRAMFVLPYIRLQSSNSFESCMFGKNKVVAKGFCRFWKANMALQPCTQSFSCRKFWRKIEATKLFSLCLWVQIMCLTPKVGPNKKFWPRAFEWYLCHWWVASVAIGTASQSWSTLQYRLKMTLQLKRHYAMSNAEGFRSKKFGHFRLFLHTFWCSNSKN